MDLLSYTFFYIVAVLMVFQGTHAFGEQDAPMGVVPEEVAQEPDRARLRGTVLAGFGYLCLTAGMLSHFYPAIQLILGPAMVAGLGLMAVYGLCVLFFNRVVKYQGVSAAPSHHDHH